MLVSYKTWTYKKFEKMIKEGRGTGELENYIPWVQVYDLSSKGYSVRIPGVKTNRIHHFLSNLEYHYFLVLSHSKKVIDIREQFPLLNYAKAMEIAKERGIRYPVDSKTKVPHILTTDFMITIKDNDRVKMVARTIKPSSELNKKRTLEKLEIERVYWSEYNIDWAIVTEKELESQRIINLKLLYHANLVVSQKFTYTILKKLALAMCYKLSNSNNFLYVELKQFEKEFSLECGGGLSIFYYLIFNHAIEFDINQKIDIQSIDCQVLRFENNGCFL
ncbi:MULTISPECIES: heteromeric transposase endonuclease subunit TnsA [Bacillus cereus group]|uniref:Heteromeric transposase endonuclease subunit TnsA n=1 Tax=Bacillus thuringiensis serovar mexicanensis TaxID=180868 RepID=A0A242VZS4_BACTU|nr:MULTISPECIES: heteromeric transposase endonuclease subunit TnsA [Bacillus cereus group]MEB9672724.1 heteromeric transposase endonuclease subunit TnsA [Bacillus anthracis]OTW44675.1 heteromeric transposase endonuclease subunit TnsA [Bacillus thuringiensis serovar mexicanensis]OTW97027.1 heteromeric transposase endonuclease subunit TnsA [Bacillus thuringiensis serovar monterrey]